MQSIREEKLRTSTPLPSAVLPHSLTKGCSTTPSPSRTPLSIQAVSGIHHRDAPGHPALDNAAAEGAGRLGQFRLRVDPQPGPGLRRVEGEKSHVIFVKRRHQVGEVVLVLRVGTP